MPFGTSLYFKLIFFVLKHSNYIFTYTPSCYIASHPITFIPTRQTSHIPVLIYLRNIC